MDNQEIIDGDKLIVEWMGEDASGGYHQSWDWLISIIMLFRDWRLMIREHEIEVRAYGMVFKTIFEEEDADIILYTYKTVIKAIKWCIENNKKRAKPV